MLRGSLGAFVNSVCLAQDEKDFASAVADLLSKYDFDVLEVKDIEPLHKRQSTYSVAPDLCELAAKLTIDNPIGLGSFHAYDARE
jgi:hypothetical protein